MIPLHGVMLAVWPLANLGEPAVAVTLRADVTELRAGDPLLLKVEAVNRSDRALRFAPPLVATLRPNLVYECRAAGDPEYLRVDMPLLSTPRSRGHPRGWETEARYVSYNYLFRPMLWHGPFARHPPAGRPKRYALAAEGEWEVRAVVLAGGNRYSSDPVKLKVRGTHPDSVAAALEQCREALSEWFHFPRSRPHPNEAALLDKHLPTLAGTAAEVPVRQAVLVSAAVTAVRQKDRQEALRRLAAFREEGSPLQREYADLLLGVAYARCGEHAAARDLLKGIPEASALRDYVERESRPKDPDK